MQRFRFFFHHILYTIDVHDYCNKRIKYIYVMMRFLKIFGVLFILLLQFTSCLKDDNAGKSVYFFYDEPVVVDRAGEHPIIRNESYMFYAPDLAKDTTLKAGDLLWSSFIVDLDSQVSMDIPQQYTASGFRYKTVDSAQVIIPEDTSTFHSYLSDDYSESIELAVLYNYTIDRLWFFGLKQQDRANQLRYVYELVLNPEIEKGSNYPTLYIRSKQINDSPEKLGTAFSKDETIFAFDVKDFEDYYRKSISSTGPVRFNLKYKTGVDATGNDIYKAFMSNPISWNFRQ